jgi:nucleotide-binding universal stress UspA family protein
LHAAYFPSLLGNGVAVQILRDARIGVEEISVTYSTLLVHLDGGRSNQRVLDVAAVIADQYNSRIIGIAACQPVLLGDCDGYVDGALAVVARDIVTDELSCAKTEFEAHAGIQPFVLDWRSITTLENIAEVVAVHARSADLIITSVGPTTGARATHADTGDLLIRAGRPILVVPDENVTADFRSIIVAWSATRECRRAIVDALPMLHRADRVTVVEISREPAGVAAEVDDVVAWLGRHGVDADRIISRTGLSTALGPGSIAAELQADLIVAGGYGHSRVAEWALGGVTRDLLLDQRRCTLLSH